MNQLNPVSLREDSRKEKFEFLIPEIPPLKNEKNIIPTGKQIPRTPLKCEILVSKPSLEPSMSESVLCGIQRDEPECENLIPKGREIPRTPPNYSSIPFLMSGCYVNPQSFTQPIDLGVKPLDDIDILDNVVVNESNITVRKHPMPKAYNLDLVLSEMIEEVNLEDGKKGMLADGSQETEVGESNVKDISKHNKQVVVKKKQTRGASKKSSVLSKQERELQDAVGVQKQRKHRSKTNAGVVENNLKDSITHQDPVDDSFLKNGTKQDEGMAVEKKKGRTKKVPEVSSLVSKEDKVFCDKNNKLEVDGDKENLFITKQELRKSPESLKNGRRRNRSEKCSLPSDLQIRRNPRRQAKEGIKYCLSPE